LGADIAPIPKAFYTPFDEDLLVEGPAEEDLEEDWNFEQRRWCQPKQIRQLFVETLNITQRYYLHRSSKLEPPTDRQIWVANRNESRDLFGIPYFLIGQTAASELLTKNFLNYMLRRYKEPLVMVFAGRFRTQSLHFIIQ
jgi:hypothetical protein